MLPLHPYNRKQNVLSASLNKTFHFLVSTPVISRFLSFLAKILGSVCDTEDIYCPTPYNLKQNVSSASLNKTFHFLVSTPVISRFLSFLAKILGSVCDTEDICCHCNQYIPESECRQGACQCISGRAGNGLGTECTIRKFYKYILMDTSYNQPQWRSGFVIGLWAYGLMGW